MLPPEDPIKQRLLSAALPHVAFDGWSESAFESAIADAGVDPTLARATCPRGALDLAVAFHKSGDRALLAWLEGADLSHLRYRDKIAALVRARLEVIHDREAVRRAMTLFALPNHAPEGARLIWDTADLIWTALGDSSQDVNWYTKRATLAAVYSATVLYWLGDETPDHAATWDFLDRRIGDVMQIEKLKARLRENPLTKPAMGLLARLTSPIHAPRDGQRQDMPGHWDLPPQTTEQTEETERGQ